MGIQLALQHRTEYRYEKDVCLGPQVIQLRPAPHCKTPILDYSLEVTPTEHILHWQFDPVSNHQARVVFPHKIRNFVVNVNLVADLSPQNPFAFFLEPGAESFPFQYSYDLASSLSSCLSVDPAGPLLRKLLESLPSGEQNTVAFLGILNKEVRDAIAYTTRLEHGVQTPEQTLELRTGSCRDSAWLLVHLCRHVGVAARFVSGYLIQLASEEQAADTHAGRLTDSADLHAWAEVFLPGAGWIGLDPTSGLFAAEGHIPLASTATPSEAAPVWGTVEPARVEFTYSISLRRVNEIPQLSKPFSAEDWEQVRNVAHAVDQDLKQQDVRLTMGGEPTYVGIDDPESPQWNLDALGPAKRTRGLVLIRRLRERTASGGLLHFGQGKWYPGETLPRWAFNCFSRKDGIPVWENVDLIALEEKDYGSDMEQSLIFARALAHRLQVSPENLLPAFNPEDEQTAMSKPIGYVMPLRRRQRSGRLVWSSQLWFPRPQPLVLSSGDSPIGYRIPPDTIPWVASDDLTYDYEDGCQGNKDRVRLPARPERRPELFSAQPADDLPPTSANPADEAKELVRPSLCIQPRDGRLHVFLPYTPVLADYLDLVAAVEDTCAYVHMPIWLEGYPPPADNRLRSFGLTPDPGVLEVNLPSTSDWDDLERLNAILAEEAHQNRLIAAKFAYDGSHLATGGGSHIVLGADTVHDSPVLRRPDLLRSLVSFWQNHPSLSYLFSGMYVGPTSQYPRIDEARVDALYEMELSFSQLPESGCPPYMIDGLFRNLLVDVTGNTHRAEFCIDKMYPPPGQGLQLGLLELRAFEMAPHYKMGLVEMLLVRALVSVFWREPYTGGLIRWETKLHDQFMLPHFVQSDFRKVLEHLRASGYSFQDKWFTTHAEFRFPKIGSLEAEGIQLELRQALEPWNVLAEETSSGGTGRSVDSSLERMQIKVSGMPSTARYLVACNGRRVPLVSTDDPGQAVAGIRYRARRLSAELHPTIPLHTPLRFDLIDTWKKRSIARCIYHAGPPDGYVHKTRPADAVEAAARRLERFQIVEAFNEPAETPEQEINAAFPMTLDLRWPPSSTLYRAHPGFTA